MIKLYLYCCFDNVNEWKATILQPSIDVPQNNRSIPKPLTSSTNCIFDVFASYQCREIVITKSIAENSKTLLVNLEL